MSVRWALLPVLGVWATGTILFPLHGMIHVLLVLALILLIVARVGRDA